MRTLRLRASALAVLLGMLVTIVPIHAVEARALDGTDGATPVYQAGFSALNGLIDDKMGLPLNDERRVDDGTAQQETTGGLLYYDSITNVPAFTDGWHHWALTDRGLVNWEGPDPVPPPPSSAPNFADVQNSGSASDIILEAASRWGVSGRQMIAVATCESKLSPSATGDHGSSQGLFQLRSPGLRDTFYAWGYHDAYNAAQASDFTGRWLASGGKWTPWTCARHLGFA